MSHSPSFLLPDGAVESDPRLWWADLDWRAVGAGVYAGGYFYSAEYQHKFVKRRLEDGVTEERLRAVLQSGGGHVPDPVVVVGDDRAPWFSLELLLPRWDGYVGLCTRANRPEQIYAMFADGSSRVIEVRATTGGRGPGAAAARGAEGIAYLFRRRAAPDGPPGILPLPAAVPQSRKRARSPAAADFPRIARSARR